MSNQIPSNLNLSSFGSLTSNIPNTSLVNPTGSITNITGKINNTKSQINKIKGSFDTKNPLKNINNPNDFLLNQDGLNSSQSISKLTGLVSPLLSKFINAEKSVNTVINRLINDNKKRLKDKGRVEIVNGSITFIPKDNANYQIYITNFNSKVKTLKTIVKTLKTIIDTLITLLKILRIALTALQIQLSLKKKKLNVQAVSAAVDLSLPIKPKLKAAKYTIDKELSDSVLKPLEDKIQQYLLMIKYINTILQIFKKLINNLKIKLDTLNLTISNLPTTDASLLQTLNETSADESTTESTTESIDEDYDFGIKQYTIKIISTPSGAIQAVAYDKFSMMKIAQTAPSKIRTADQLLDEIRQILG